jgi:two-component system OmpR family sensor kinase
VTARTLSIRSRLTLWYACSILLLFTGVGMALRVAVRRTLLSEFDHDALDSSALVRRFFHVEAAEYQTVEQAVTDLVAEVVFSDRAIQFTRPDGSLLLPMHTAPDTLSHRLPTIPAYVRPPVRTLTVPLDTDRAPGWSIRIVSSAAALERTLHGVDQWFLLGGSFLALLAAALGWTLAGRLLQPVDAMARAAEQITAAEPSARLPVRNAHDEIGRLGRSFNGLLVRLDGALSQQRRFLADAAHELRTPVARMTSLVELTLHAPPDTAAASESLVLIAGDLRHASRLLDELLQLARADAGERMQRLERVFLDDVVMDALRTWQPAAARGRIALCVGDVHEAPIRVDPLLARRLVDTLFENAVRYTPPGGRVEATVRNDRDRVVLDISDSGIGVSPAELPHVFERFFRGASSRAMAPEGSGLGLPIAAWIVEQCGGAIELAPGALGGTCARVSLPMDLASGANA